MDNGNNIIFFDSKLSRLKQEEEAFQLDIKNLSAKEKKLSTEKAELKKQIVILEQSYMNQVDLICDNEEALYDLDDSALVRFLNHNFFERKNNESLVHYLSKLAGGLAAGVTLGMAGSYVTLVYPYVVLPLLVSAGLGAGVYSVFTADKRKSKKLTKQNEIRFNIRHLEEISEGIEEAIKLLQERIEDIDTTLRDISFHIYSAEVNLDIIHQQIDQTVEYFHGKSKSLESQTSTDKGFEKRK